MNTKNQETAANSEAVKSTGDCSCSRAVTGSLYSSGQSVYDRGEPCKYVKKGAGKIHIVTDGMHDWIVHDRNLSFDNSPVHVREE